MSTFLLELAAVAMAVMVVTALVIAFVTVRRRAAAAAEVPAAVEAPIGAEPTPQQAALQRLDIVRIRVPGLDPSTAFGRKDAVSVLLRTEYFALLRKLGASGSAPAR